MKRLAGILSIVFVTAVVFAGCGGGGGDESSTPDTTPPDVLNTIPVAGSNNVDIAQEMVIIFSESMDSSTINTTNCYMSGGATVAVSYNPSANMATLTPASSMSYATTYTVTITADVADSAGNTLSGGYSWSFRTEPDTYAPIVTSVNPANGATEISVNLSSITATFNESMAGGTITNSTFTVSGLTGTVSYNNSTYTATFTPSGLLPYNTLLTATITTGAQDLYGNPIASDYVWTFRTEVDIIAPTVSSTNPINDQSLTSVDTGIKVVFSESMAPGTLNNSTFTVSGVPGTVTYNNPSLTATFSPNSPLNYLNNYMVSLSTGITDAQGIPLTSQYQWGFNTAEQAVKVSGNTPSNMKEPALLFKSNGDGIAVWISEPGGNDDGYRVLYSLYTESTQTWSTESVLDSSPKDNSPKVHLETNGTGFLVVWNAEYSTPPYGELFAAVYAPGSGWSVTTLANEYGNLPKLASNGSGYAVAWRGVFQNSIWGAIYSGTSWTTTLLYSGSPSEAQLVSNGTTYCITYYANKQVYATIYNGSSWPPATTIFNPTDSDVSNHVTGHALASNGSGFAAVWCYNFDRFLNPLDYDTYAAVYSGSTWSASTTLSTGSQGPSEYLITSNGSGYFTIYTFVGVPNTVITSKIYTTQWVSGGIIASMSTPGLTPLALTSNGTGYAAAFLRGGATGDLAVNVYSGSSWIGTTTLDSTGTKQDVSLKSGPLSYPSYVATWGKADGSGPYYSPFGGGTWSPPGALDASADPAKDPVLDSTTAYGGANGYVAVWSQSDTIYARHYRAGWQTARNLVTGSHSGSAMNPRITSTSSGLLMAVWEQYIGTKKGIYASYRPGAVWSTPYQVAAQGQTPDVATNGANNFIVLWENTDPADQGIKSRRYNISTGIWDSLVTVKSSTGLAHDPVITTKGNEYVVAWEETDVYLSTSTSSGSTWTTPFKVSSFGGEKPQIVSNGTGYFVAYAYPGSFTDGMRGRVYNGTTWEAVRNFGDVAAYQFYTKESWDVATDGTGYALTWENGGIYTATYNGTTWSSNTLISGSTSSNKEPRVEWGGSEYLALWKWLGSTYASTFNGVTWSAQARMPNNGVVGLASNGTGFSTLYLKDDGTYSSVASHYYNSGEWGGGDGYVEGHTGDASTPVVIRWSNAYYAGAWGRASDTSAAGEIWSIKGY